MSLAAQTSSAADVLEGSPQRILRFSWGDVGI